MQREKMKSAGPSQTSFTLSDFYQAAFLICSGLELIRAERVSSNRVAFILQDSPRRDALIQDFYARRALVDPLKFKDAISNLKALIHGLRPEGTDRHA